jgi:hypothetical protein
LAFVGGRTGRILLLVVGVALAAAPAAHARAQTPLGGQSFGLIASNANFLPADHAAAYRRLYEMGVRAVRLDFTWAYVESRRGVYDWSDRDREVGLARGAGLQVIGILCCGNKLYSTPGAAADQTPVGSGGGLPPFGVGWSALFPPDDPADYARFAHAAAAHFAGRVGAWEVWNEENEGYRFWEPREDPAAYGRLLCAAHDAVRQADTDAPVLFGGVFFPAVPTTGTGTAGAPGMSGPDFVKAAYAADPRLGRCFDVMAYHPYPYPFTSPELDVPVRGSVLAAADAMRAAMPDAKPLWITEVGWPTHAATYGVSEAKQAQYSARMAAATFAQGVPVLTYYTYGDAADPTGGANQEAWFGFFRPDGSAKPSSTALSVFAHTVSGTRFRRDLSAQLGLPAGGNTTGGRGFALRYVSAWRTVTAVWLATESVAEGQGALPDGGTLTPPSQRVEVPVRGSEATLVSMLGERSVVRVHRGVVAVRAGPSPRYVIAGR